LKSKILKNKKSPMQDNSWIKTKEGHYIKFSDIIRFTNNLPGKIVEIEYKVGNETRTQILKNTKTEVEGKVIIENIIVNGVSEYIVKPANLKF